VGAGGGAQLRPLGMMHTLSGQAARQADSHQVAAITFGAALQLATGGASLGQTIKALAIGAGKLQMHVTEVALIKCVVTMLRQQQQAGMKQAGTQRKHHTSTAVGAPAATEPASPPQQAQVGTA
jgi:hypothetical protein